MVRADSQIRRLTDEEIKEFVKKKFTFRGLFKKDIELRDPYYLLYPFCEIKKALQQLPDIPDYFPNEFDCNSIADFIIGNLKALLRGAALMYIKGCNDRAGCHAWPAIIDDAKTIHHITVRDDSFNKRRAVFDMAGADTIADHQTIIKIRF